jgi:hypothetical protein
MFKKLLLVFIASSVSLLANAQFGSILGGIVGGGGSGASPDQLLAEYFLGASAVLNAQAKILTAVGLKDQADLAESNAANMKDGATTDAIKDAEKVQTENSLKIQEALADKNLVLDENAKKQIGEGYASLAAGAISYIVFIKDAKNFKPGPTSFGKAVLALVVIVPRIPNDIKNLMNTIKSVSEYAKENKIPAPKDDPTSALGSLV